MERLELRPLRHHICRTTEISSPTIPYSGLRSDGTWIYGLNCSIQFSLRSPRLKLNTNLPRNAPKSLGLEFFPQQPHYQVSFNRITKGPSSFASILSEVVPCRFTLWLAAQVLFSPSNKDAMQKIILAGKARAFRPAIAPHLVVLFSPSNKDVMQRIILADEARAFPPGAEAQSGRQPHLVLTRPEPSHIYATSTTGARRTLNDLRRRIPQGGAYRHPLIIRRQMYFFIYLTMPSPIHAQDARVRKTARSIR